MLTLIQIYFAYSNNRKQFSPFSLIFSFIMMSYYYVQNLYLFLNKLNNKIFNYMILNLKILKNQFTYFLDYFKIIDMLIDDLYIYQKTNICGDTLWLSFINNKEIYKLYTL